MSRSQPNATETVTFALRLKPVPGAVDAYRQRHDMLWPEMRSALIAAGVIEYEIHLEPESRLLFAWMRRRHAHGLDAMRQSDVWRRWQVHMSDLLEMADGAPLRVPLYPMFCLE